MGKFPKGGLLEEGYPTNVFPLHGLPIITCLMDRFHKGDFPKGRFPRGGFPIGGFSLGSFLGGGFPSKWVHCSLVSIGEESNFGSTSNHSSKEGVRVSATG